MDTTLNKYTATHPENHYHHPCIMWVNIGFDVNVRKHLSALSEVALHLDFQQFNYTNLQIVGFLK